MKRGPRHRRNRGKGGSQFSKCSAIAQPRQVGQLAFAHEAVGQFRIHAIETHNYGALDLCLAIRLAPSEQAEQLSEWPSEQGVEGIKKGDKDRPERRQDGESRARPRVRLAAMGNNSTSATTEHRPASRPASSVAIEATSYLNSEHALEDKTRDQRKHEKQDRSNSIPSRRS